MQKVFTVDFLTKKVKKNEGEVPQYYVKGSHPGIIDPEEWQAVQDEMKRRKAKAGYHHGLSPFAGKIYCGECGAPYGPKVWHSNDPYRKVVWRCNSKYERKGEAGAQRCSTPHLTEDEIKSKFCAALGVLIEDRERLTEDVRLLRAELADTSALEGKAVGLTSELTQINSVSMGVIQQNAATAQDQEVYDQRYSELTGRYVKTQKKLDAVTKEIEARESKARALDEFERELREVDTLSVSFTSSRWNAMVERVDVLSDGRMVFRFVCGREITVQ